MQRTQGRATSTVNGHLSALRALCAWLTEERYLEVNPARRLKLVGRQEASKREGLSDTQANALLRQAQVSRDARRNYAIVQMLLQTGIRLDECSQLTLEDIEFGERSGRVMVRLALQVPVIFFSYLGHFSLAFFSFSGYTDS